MSDEAVTPCPSCHRLHPPGAACGPAQESSETLVRPSAAQLESGSGASSPIDHGSGDDPLIGATVGSFKLVKQLGKGGMGSVYLGEHPVIGSKVAIKFLHESLSSSPELVKRFYDEARAVNLIGHEHIVSIFDLNQLPPNRYYIVMEHLEGQTLASLLRQGPIDVDLAISLLAQLCDALQMAHTRGVVHRDLKPENIFLVKRGALEHFVKLVDFGIAKLRDEAAPPSQTATGVLVGTPEYMSPEQAENLPADPRSDIYSLGVIAYRMFTGRLPFAETSVARLILAHLEKVPPAPRALNPALSPELEDVVLRAMAKKPEQRFPEMRALARALEDARGAAQSPGFELITPEPRSVPVPVRPEQPRHEVDFEVEVLSPEPAQKLRAADISRGGLFLCTASALPALFTRVKLGIPRPAPGARLEIAAEVVRHVSAAEARAWNMAPGFGVQFVELGAEDRAALSELVGQLPRVSTTPAATPRQVEHAPRDPQLDAFLDFLRRQVPANHYDLLGVPLDASFAAITAAGRALNERLASMQPRAKLPEQSEPLAAGEARIRAALDTLSTPATRVDYDAQRGNFRGVARCMEAGLPAAVLLARHKAFATLRPGLDVRIQQQLGRIKIARGRDNAPAALREYEVALQLDPLNAELHRGYWALKRQVEAGSAG